MCNWFIWNYRREKLRRREMCMDPTQRTFSIFRCDNSSICMIYKLEMIYFWLKISVSDDKIIVIFTTEKSREPRKVKMFTERDWHLDLVERWRKFTLKRREERAKIVLTQFVCDYCLPRLYHPGRPKKHLKRLHASYFTNNYV